MAARELPSGIVLMWKKYKYPEILRILTLFSETLPSGIP
jgi:hypothetical protein